MPVPETLLKLLTAAGPSGYEQAPAAVFREAAGAFAEVTHDSVGSTVAKRARHRATAAPWPIVGHIDEIGLIVHHIDDDGFLWFTGVGGWDPVILVGQRVEIATRDGVVLGVVGKKPIHLLKTEEPQEGARAQGPAHRHRRQGRRRGALAGAHRRRRGDRRRAASSCPTAGSSRARWTTASAASSRSRRRGWSPRPAARPATSYAHRRRAGGDHLRGRAHDRVLAAARRRDRRRRDVRHRRARASTRRSSAATASARAR